mgnify:CR=1 FL=1
MRSRPPWPTRSALACALWRRKTRPAAWRTISAVPWRRWRWFRLGNWMRCCGLAIKTQPLAGVTLDDLLSGDKPARVCVLDQVSDPQNLGAVFRSAAAFGVGALILQTRHSPPITGAVAKSAAGAAETVTDVRVVNIARALETLAEAGYRTVGLAGGAGTRLDHAVAGADRLAIVLGAEGAGLRPAVAKACDVAAHIPIAFEMESLNLSNAAAIAFYEAARPAFSAEPGAGM